MFWKKKNPLSKHLKEGDHRIIACMMTFDEIKESEGILTDIFLHPNDYISTAENIDYAAGRREIYRLDLKNDGFQTYVISSINGKDKFSRYLYDCTSLIAVGIEKHTGENISFATHQDPEEFLPIEKHREKFTSDLCETLRELKSRCIQGTIDAVIAGGMYLPDDRDKPSERLERVKIRIQYIDSILFLSDLILKIFNFEPVIIAGPKTVDRSDIVFFETKDRRLFLVRPQTGDYSSESYLPCNIKLQEKKWK